MGLAPITSGRESLASLTLHCYHCNPLYMDYFFLKVKVAQSRLTLCNLMDYTVHGIL